MPLANLQQNENGLIHQKITILKEYAPKFKLCKVKVDRIKRRNL